MFDWPATIVGALDLSILRVAATTALGGCLNASEAAQTLSKKITAMEPDHELWANLVTSFLVIFASKWGMPVSTTHVSGGALFGIGLDNGGAYWPVIRVMLLAWLLTLPAGASMAVLNYGVLSRM